MNTVSLCLENVETALLQALSASGPAYLQSAVRRESRRRARPFLGVRFPSRQPPKQLPSCGEVPWLPPTLAQPLGAPPPPPPPPCPQSRAQPASPGALQPSFLSFRILNFVLADARPRTCGPTPCLCVRPARCRVKIRLSTRPGLLQLPGPRSPLLIG